MNHPRARLAGFIMLIFWALLLYGTGSVGADSNSPGDGRDLCARAQGLIAETDVIAENTLHHSYDAFVESKAVAYPLQTQQLYSNPLLLNSKLSDSKLYAVVSCKMRTATSIAQAYSTAGESAVVGEDQSCHHLVKTILMEVRSAMDAKEKTAVFKNIVVEDEELTFMGPMWLSPWPFQSAYRHQSGTLHLKSRALYVPGSWYIPAPVAFKGVYYCHLPAPDYLQALLLGQVDAPLEQ